jgi:hypothetical protein
MTPLLREVRLLLRVEKKGWRRFAARLTFARLPRADVRPVFAPIELLPGIEHEDVDALLGKVPRSHSAGGSAADDDDRIDPGGVDDLHFVRIRRSMP